LENHKRILVIRLSSIGDVILTTPVLKAFKEKYPESIIDFLVIDKFKDAISLSPYVDNLLLFNKEKNDGLSNLIKFAKELSKNEYNYVFDLHSKFRSKIITFILSKFYKVKSYTYKKTKKRHDHGAEHIQSARRQLPDEGHGTQSDIHRASGESGI